jgi:hypothetical protein
MSRASVLLLILVGSFFVAGVAEPFVAKPGEPLSVAAFVHSLVIAVICYAWCQADAMARGISLPSGSALIAGLLPPVGIPLYFFRSRPWRAALIASLKALAALVAMLLVFSGGYLLATTMRA